MSDETGTPSHPPVAAIRILGAGAVSPAGWGCGALWEALHSGHEIASHPLPRPGWKEPLSVRQVPPPASRPEFLKNPRLRRASAITQYAVAAALEAVGPHAACQDASLPLGVILCTMSGCVQYSRRFYSETLQDPAMASPLVFPETVFNAPASHLASLLGSAVVDYTLVGDTSTYFQGLAMAAHWLDLGKVRACLVVGAEEMDWPTADAFRLFSRDMTLSAGAGALFLQAGPPTASDDAILECVPTPRGYHNARGRCLAMEKVKEELPRLEKDDLLCDGRQDIDRLDRPETLAWKSWTGGRVSPKRILGEGLTSAAAWQCIAAVSALREGRTRRAMATNAGCNQQAGGVSFIRPVDH